MVIQYGLSVSYTHLDVYKRQVQSSVRETVLTVFKPRNTGFLYYLVMKSWFEIRYTQLETKSQKMG